MLADLRGLCMDSSRKAHDKLSQKLKSLGLIVNVNDPCLY